MRTLACLILCCLHAMVLAQTPTPAQQELRKLHAEDQADRQFKKPPTAADWARIGDRDRARRKRVAQLLQDDKLLDGTDFGMAATIFQHGDQPADFLIAFEMALIAAAEGNFSSAVADALDRYLNTIGQKQRFGTQFDQEPDGKWKLKPVEQAGKFSVNDFLRLDFFVPRLEAMAKSTTFEERDYKPLIERLQQRLNPQWIEGKRAATEIIELGSLAVDPLQPNAIDSVLKIYNSDGLGISDEYFYAGYILYKNAKPIKEDESKLALAVDLLSAALMRNSPRPKKIFPEVFNAWLTSLGQEPIYKEGFTGRFPAVKRFFKPT